jgi:hypothetical protein
MFEDVDINTHTYCISINKKRYEYLCKNFNSVGLASPTLFRGVRWNRGSNTGCVLSHMALIHMCKQMDLPYCIIYEDDAYPRPDVINVWNNVKLNIPSDCGLLKLGSSSYRGYVKHVNSCIDIMQSGSAFGSHAYIICKCMYDIVMYYMCNNNIPEAFLNLEYFEDCTYKPYVLNFNNLMFIQKNINMDNIISRIGGERYWYPNKENGTGVTSSVPCENFVDCLIGDEYNYIENLCIVSWDGFKHGKKTGCRKGNIIYTKDESCEIYNDCGDFLNVKWNSRISSNTLRFDGVNNDVYYYTVI